MDGLTYEALHGLAEHVVDYHGVIKLEPDTQAAWAAGPEYLVLGDKTNAFAKPCVMDVKIGTQTFEPDAPADKQARDLAKYPRQAEVGFRLIGMRVLTYGADGSGSSEPRFTTKGKKYGRRCVGCHGVMLYLLCVVSCASYLVRCHIAMHAPTRVD